MSPTGIFATHNAVANDNVQRHMIFMTDGDTDANPDAMSAYGVAVVRPDANRLGRHHHYGT